MRFNEVQDLGGEDNPICAAGTFNKLMEKLSGIHADVQVDYITHELASFKFQKLAEEQAIRYLQSLTAAQTAEDYRQVKDLLEQLKQDGSLERIWDKMKARVQEEVWDEFKVAYAHRPDDARFLALIDNGQYLPSPDLSAVKKT
jgi:beta-phosphoglucomutase-like phosphatase (HAD superfamily)